MDIEALTKVYVEEFLAVEFIATNEHGIAHLLVFVVITENSQREEVHGVSCIDSNINTIEEMDAFLSCSQLRIVFDIVTHQGPIVDNFTED